MRKMVAIVLLLSSLGVLNSQGKLIGSILQQDSTSLAGASIYVDGAKFGTASNTLGKFRLYEIPAGHHTVVVSCVGYKTTRKEILIKNGEETHITVLVKEAVTDLPDFVVSGVSLTGGNVGVKDLPGSAYYISPKELQRFNYTDVNRTLRGIPGVNIQEEDGFGLRPNIGLRGSGVERNSKITVMEDGVLMAPAPYTAPAAYYFPTIGRMQAVEVMKGSSQIKYGPYTTGGAINMISTQIPNEFSGKVNLMTGSYGIKTLHANVGASYKNFGYMVETFQYGADGFKQLDNGGNTGFDKKDFLAKFRVNTNEDAKFYQSLTFKLAQVNEISNETYLGLTQGDFDKNPLRRYAASQKDQITTSQQVATATHYIRFSEKIDVQTTAYYTKFSRNWYKLQNFRDSSNQSVGLGGFLQNPESNPYIYEVMTGGTSVNSNALNLRANNRDYYSKGVQSVLGVHFKTGEIQHRIDAGIRYHFDEMDRFQWDDQYKMVDGVMMLTKTGIPGSQDNRIEDAQAVASFVQYQLRYKKLTATPGLRYENILMRRMNYSTNDVERLNPTPDLRSNRAEVFIPGVGIDYKFNEYVSSFVGVHKGFSPQGSAPDALPEESVNYEVGTSYSSKAFAGKLVLFYNDYSNLLGTDLQAGGGGGTTDLYNGGAAQSHGVELLISYDLIAKEYNKYRLPLTFSYTYTDAFFKNSFASTFGDWGTVVEGDRLPYIAENQLFAMLSLESDKFAVSLSARYMDKVRTQAGQGDFNPSETISSYVILDASASYNLQKGVALFGSVTNLTNETYIAARRPYGLRPGMPRAFITGIKANF
jgi:Fe(3+) dicitrate transport protein